MSPEQLADRYIALWNGQSQPAIHVSAPRQRRAVGDAVKFNLEMVSEEGEVAAVGLEFLLLAPDGRIERDYQFIES